MIRKTLLSIGFAAACAVGFSALPAAAAESSAAGVVIEPAGVNIGVHIWDVHRDGPRCRWRLGGCRYYYRGWWYQRPWWQAPPPRPVYIYQPPPQPYVIEEPSYGQNPHVAWCMGRYRSYDPGSDSFVGFDGYRHRCISPYDY